MAEASGFPREEIMSTTGNAGLDALADAIAERVIARIHQAERVAPILPALGATR